jgi:hypothetical protein
MPTQSSSKKIIFCCRKFDTPNGVTYATVKSVAERLGVDLTQALHIAMYQLATRVLPPHEPDNRRLGPARTELSLVEFMRRSPLFGEDAVLLEREGKLTR